MSGRYYRSAMAKPPAPSDLADKFMLRLPDGMRDRIAEAAHENKRSMNAEIVARLQNTFDVRHLSSNLLNPEGLEAMRELAGTAERALAELKAVTLDAEKQALAIMRERDGREAAERELARLRFSISPDTKGEGE